MRLEERLTWQVHLAEATVIFFDWHPCMSPFWEVWTSQGPHMIVVNQGSELNWTHETRGWHVWSTTLKHWETGGVMDWRGCFTFYVRDQLRLEIFKTGLEKGWEKALRQDLRCVLKVGILGIPMQPSEEDLEHVYKSQVVWVWKTNIISWPLVPRRWVLTILGEHGGWFGQSRCMKSWWPWTCQSTWVGMGAMEMGVNYPLENCCPSSTFPWRCYKRGQCSIWCQSFEE